MIILEMRNSTVIKYHFTRISTRERAGGRRADGWSGKRDYRFGINTEALKFVDDNFDDVRLNISEESSLL